MLYCFHNTLHMYLYCSNLYVYIETINTLHKIIPNVCITSKSSDFLCNDPQFHYRSSLRRKNLNQLLRISMWIHIFCIGARTAPEEIITFVREGLGCNINYSCREIKNPRTQKFLFFITKKNPTCLCVFFFFILSNYQITTTKQKINNTR